MKKRIFLFINVSLLIIVLIIIGVIVYSLVTKGQLFPNKTTATIPAAPTTKAGAEKSANATNEPQEIEKTFAFHVQKISKKIKNPYGITVKYDFAFPRLSGNYGGIDAINKYYELKEKEYFELKNYTYLNEDSEDIQLKNSAGSYYFLTAQYRLETKIGDIISIVGDANSGAFGVSTPEIIGDVFDLVSARKLGLDDIFKTKKKEYFKMIIGRVSQDIKTEIAKQKAEDGFNDFFFNSPYSSEGRKAISGYNVNDFYLTKNALVVFYPKYALATGAAGPQSFEIPFESILDELAIEVHNVPVTRLLLNKISMNLNSSKSFQLRASVSPENASNPSVTWKSSDVGVADVNEYGVVKAKRQGTAIITAESKYGNQTVTCEVTVIPNETIGFFQEVTWGDYMHVVIKDLKGKELSFWNWGFQGAVNPEKLKKGQKIKITWQNVDENIREAGGLYNIDEIVDIELVK